MVKYFPQSMLGFGLAILAVSFAIIAIVNFFQTSFWSQSILLLVGAIVCVGLAIPYDMFYRNAMRE